MKNKPRYIIRIPCSNLLQARSEFSAQGLLPFYSDSVDFIDWYIINKQVISVKESEDQHIALAKYVHNIEEQLKIFEDLGIIGTFTANENGQCFEYCFYDPGGTSVIIAESTDLPSNITPTQDSIKNFELALPSCSDLKDSSNFWYFMGFQIECTSPKNHPWVTLIDNDFKIGIHQHYKWTLPGLLLHKDLEIDLKLIPSIRLNLYFK
jgi:hypothetical protein